MCHKCSPIPHISHHCRKWWPVFQQTISVCKWGGVQQTSHLWLRSFNSVLGILHLLKRISHFFLSRFSVDPNDDPANQQLELIELQCDVECHCQHQQLPLVNIYCWLDKDRFQEIWTFSKKMLSLFGLTYLCKMMFTVMNINKNRVRTKQSHSPLCDILRIKTTVFEPDLPCLLQSRSQYHLSY